VWLAGEPRSRRRTFFGVGRREKLHGPRAGRKAKSAQAEQEQQRQRQAEQADNFSTEPGDRPALQRTRPAPGQQPIEVPEKQAIRDTPHEQARIGR